MIWNYHYNFEVKKVGFNSCIFKIEKDWVDAVVKIQEHMKTVVSDKGIYVECNPTSNVLINNFNLYEKHPIFNMNNRMLGGGNLKDIKITINTDDQGIFNNSLENEYALILKALLNQDGFRNGDYDRIMAEQWIDTIRQNSIDSSFKKKTT